MKKRTRMEREMVINDCVKAILAEMEKKNITVGDAKEIPKRLKKALKMNSERFSEEKPFAVFQYDD